MEANASDRARAYTRWEAIHINWKAAFWRGFSVGVVTTVVGSGVIFLTITAVLHR